MVAADFPMMCYANIGLGYGYFRVCMPVIKEPQSNSNAVDDTTRVQAKSGEKPARKRAPGAESGA